tara:strand:+ start:456 stop:590 length:135 start_codon:yes stop_codon:yes gene_type:complete
VAQELLVLLLVLVLLEVEVVVVEATVAHHQAVLVDRAVAVLAVQ